MHFEIACGWKWKEGARIGFPAENQYAIHNLILTLDFPLRRGFAVEQQDPAIGDFLVRALVGPTVLRVDRQDE
jgi:hypothetical protein